MKNSFPFSKLEVADSQGRKHIVIVVCNNKSFVNGNNSLTAATSIAIVDLDANTYKNDNVSK